MSWCVKSLQVAKSERDFSASVYGYLKDRNPRVGKNGATKCKEFFKLLAKLAAGEEIPVL